MSQDLVRSISRPLRLTFLRSAAALLLFVCIPSLATSAQSSASSAPQTPQQRTEALLVRTMKNPEFRAKSYGRVTWIDHGAAYLHLEPSPKFPEARDIVRYDTAAGQKTVLLPATKLIPPGASEPLRIQGFSLSHNDRRVLIYTNSRRVWR